MKYIKRFNVLNEFNDFAFDDTNTPNVSLIEELEQPENLAFISLMPHNYSKDYLTFIPAEDSTFSFSMDGLSYSTNNGQTWTELAANGTTPTIAAGEKIMWKNNTELTPVFNDGIGNFTSSNIFDVQGNIMSLLFGDNFIGKTSLKGLTYTFQKIFASSKVRNANKLSLPAMTLAKECYRYMFGWCKYLITAPALPAKNLAYDCYNNMFNGCTSLTTAPDLTEKILVMGCYLEMFYNCSSLNYVKMTATSVNMKYYFTGIWLNGVSPTGTFVKSSAAEWKDEDVIPSGWTIIEI